MALDTLEAQGQMANTNPNIISDTYTGDNASGGNGLMPAPPSGNSMPAPQTNVPGMADASNVATTLANNLYASNFVPGMESQRNAMMQELYDYDNMLGRIYEGQSYFPQVEGYVDNPADMTGAIAGVSGATGSDIGRTAATIDATERAYNMAISNVMDRFMDFYSMQQQQRMWERELDLKEKEAGLSGSSDEADRMAMAVLFGADPQQVTSGNLVGALASAGQAQTGPTPQSLRNAMLMNNAGAEKYMKIYQQYAGGGAGELPATMQRQVISNQSTSRQLQDLWDLYNQIPSYQKGPVGQGQVGSVMGAFSSSNLADQFDELRWAIATNIARNLYGETGVVSDTDVERIAQSLPSRFEQEQKAGQKFTRMMSNLESGMADIYNIAGANSGGTGGLMNTDVYGEYGSPSNTDVYAGGSDMEVAVEDLQSGMKGWIPEEEFDPNKYRRL